MKKNLLGLALANPVVATQEAASVDLDGVNDYFSRASDFTGNADSKTFTMSFYLYADSNNATANPFIFQQTPTTASRNYFGYNTTTGALSGFFKNSANGIILNLDGLFVSLNTWNHFIISCDMSDPLKRHIYMSDKIPPALSWLTYTNDTIEFTHLNTTIGATSAGADLHKGRLSNVFLSREYLDLSVEANRRIFTTIDPNKGLIPNPNQLADYNASYGNVTFYFPMDDPSTAHINAAGNGDMVQNGTIARSNRGPNQYNAVASDFTGTGDYLSSASIGGANSDTITLSFSGAQTLVAAFAVVDFTNGATQNNQITARFSSGALQIVGRDSSATVILNALLAGVIGAHHTISISIDISDVAKRNVVVDGVDVTTSITWLTYNTAATFYLATSTSHRIGAKYNGTTPYGEVGDLYFDTSYIDLSASNPFWDSATNKPKYLGEAGELPTGSSPLIYLPLRADDAGNNLGTGGDFTVNSGPFVGARGASEYIARGAAVDGANYLTGSIFCQSLVKWKSLDSGITWAVSYSNAVTVTDIGNGTDNGVVAYYFGTNESINFGLESETLRFTDGLGFPIPPVIDANTVLFLDFSDTSNFGLNKGSGANYTETGTITAGADVNV